MRAKSTLSPAINPFLTAVFLVLLLANAAPLAAQLFENENEAGPDFVKLGDMVEAFTPPTLEELNAKAEWIDQPVFDAIEELRKQQAKTKPELTPAEALKLKNDSPANNAKILDALSRLPANEDEVDYDATFYRHMPGGVRSTVPLLISSTDEFDLVGYTSFGLFGFDAKMEPFADKDTVVSWQTSKDRMFDKVVIRDDLTWSDGKPITAHDVAFSYQAIMTSAVPVPAVRSGTDQLRFVHAYDDHTVVFFHKEPLATNVWNINFTVIPKHVYERSILEDPTLSRSVYHRNLDEKPVAGGPYKLVSRKWGEEIILERREDYYMHKGKQVRKKPYFKTIHFKIIGDPSTALLALKKGRIDNLSLRPDQWVLQTVGEDFYEQNTKVRGTEYVYFYFGWNCKTVLFEDPRVRQAMSLALDYDTLHKKILQGVAEPAVGIFHPESKYAPQPAPAPLTQNLKAAAKRLEDAGWTDSDGDGWRDKMVDGKLVTFEFTMITSNLDERVELCSMFADDLEKIGVRCSIVPTEFTVLQQKARDHQFQAMFGGWGTGTDPDTCENLWTTAAIDEGRNYVQYSNKQVDELFERGKRELDPEKRTPIYQEIATILWKDQPYTWLYFRNSMTAFNKDVRGYNMSPRGVFNYSPGAYSLWKAKTTAEE